MIAAGATPDRHQAVGVALALADVARPVLMQHFRRGVTVDDKADLSPVTIADRDAEAAMRDALRRLAPDHGVLGEEHGSERIDAEFVWVLDPIDGTKSFITGKPLFGTLIALCQHGVPVVGVIDMPALGERFLGADDRGASFNGQPIRTRNCAHLSDAMLYATSPHMFVGRDAAAFARLTGAVKHPLYGADCYAYAMTAAGWSDLVVEASLKPYDFCACAAVLAAAGGASCDWLGRPLTLESDGRVIMTGDARLLAPTLAQLDAHGNGSA